MVLIQNETKEKLKRMRELKERVDQCTEHQMEYIRNVSSQINAMRETIRNLMSQYGGDETIKDRIWDESINGKETTCL